MRESQYAAGHGEEAVTWTDKSHGVVALERIDVGAVTGERVVDWNNGGGWIRYIIIIDSELVEIEFVSKD